MCVCAPACVDKVMLTRYLDTVYIWMHACFHECIKWQSDTWIELTGKEAESNPIVYEYIYI